MQDFYFLTWWQDTTLFDISLGNWVFAAAVAVGVYFILSLALRLVLRRMSSYASQTDSRADDVVVDVLAGTNRGLILIVALLIGIGMLDLPDRWAARVGQLWFVAAALQIALWANRIIGAGLRRHVDRHSPTGTARASAAATLVSWGLRTLVWTVVLLAMLSNVGVNITAFIASLGVGGIAIALAAQNVLGDLFASLSIAVDKPFEVGDFIVLGPIAGTVEQVGVKTTRIRSLGGEQIVMSNTELLKQTVSNYKRLAQRRVVFGVRISYAASADQAQAVPDVIKRAVTASTRLRFDRAHLKAFGDSSLDYEAVYIVLDPDYNVYMDEQQRINLALMRDFETLGVEIAFPTRMLHIAPTSSAKPASDARPRVSLKGALAP